MKHKNNKTSHIPCTVPISDSAGERVRELNKEYRPPVDEGAVKRKPCKMYESIYEAVMDHLKEHPNKPVFGHHNSPSDAYRWVTYREFCDMLSEFGSGLKYAYQIEPGSSTRVGIFAVNCLEWVVTHLGLLFYSNVAVPLYSTLGEEALVHIAQLTEMRVCVCMDAAKARMLLETLAKHKSSLQHVVLMRPSEDMAKLRKDFPSVSFATVEEVRKTGLTQGLIKFRPPPPDGMYVINFTSGTTGVPKGVVITCSMFKHVIHAVLGSGNYHNLWTLPWMDDKDIYFSFLPLAHVLEQTMMAASIFCRSRVGFFSGDMNSIMDDIACLKPTIVAFVPRLLIRIYDATLQKLRDKHIPQSLLNTAVRTKLRHIENTGKRVNNTFWDKILFKGVQQKLGGSVRLVITGSAACPSHVLDFTRAALGASVHVGYGSTETGGLVSLSFAHDVEAHHVGALITGVQVKLADVDEMELRDGKRGEICVRGPNCTKGYFKDAEKTRELIDSQGWLHTGDVGEWDAQGRLCIVDRCKNLFKLSQGEYVAPDKVEGVYSSCSLVAQCFLDGRSEESFAVAVVHPNEKRLFDRLQKDPKKTTFEQLCESEEARHLVLEEMNRLARDQGLKGFELAKKIILTAQPFTVENGQITATLKPVRAKIRDAYHERITQLYKSSS